MSTIFSSPGAIVLLVVLAYLLVRVFIVAHPKNEKTVKEVFEDMLLELVGAGIILVLVALSPLFL